MYEAGAFCDQSWMGTAEIFIETPHRIFVSTRHPGIRAQAGLAKGILPGSGAIVPIAHRTSVFELTPAEWQRLIIPRFDDEPLSDRWLGPAINVPENRRPDPWAPGSGRADRAAG